MAPLMSFLFSLAITIKLLFAAFLFTLLAATIVGPLIYFYFKYTFRLERKKRGDQLSVGIFHPYANAGGGGEKVLWVALRALLEKYPEANFYIYTGDVECSPVEIKRKVKNSLNVDIKSDRVKFIYLTRRRWVEASMFPIFTLLGQCIGSMWLGLEAISLINPDIFIETTGFTFTLPLFKYLGECKTGCYVHYPIINKGMLRRVQSRRNIYNNSNLITNSSTLTYSKLFYYHLLAWMYSLAGQCSDTTLVNSTFTLENLQILWNLPMSLVYPPCEVDHLKKIIHDAKKPSKIRILSLAQFRPEKDHPLQLQALYDLREIIADNVFENVTLVLCGSCRNQEDSNRVKDLQDLAKHLSLENNVEFKVNIPYAGLLEEFSKAYVGIHTMLDEHFGISVVEQMAAGLIVVAHKSGGPLLDIIETSEGSRLGFLANTSQEFAHILKWILEATDEEINEIRERAKASCDRFSVKKFEVEFLRAIEPIFK
ncbi:GDP-Man:Man(3)GlcNAc(2)-PP-Dol alpha-1,2-mannosyltransferase [Anthonomus grandis grandis]|uniref:GDP-Man:Man(3)GlcNAc(2)-PP-Dol alpha-1,2-mannosyltransferase n=1 Tax=Anthonomus grandis grandis TaxID=2921223 RepID=UPI002165D558|nr:GDP-Man:Man(3)GlcNAc(2)-PP-Dol alpha-1,2-mannosyltransferase [Anthonomus grandis grandis]